MKNRVFYLFCCLVFGQLVASAQGIEFFHGTWSEALERSKTEKKLIFVDAFAKWCGPCKRMAATTFVDPEVGEFFNKNFINLKIDMEEAENADFARKYPVSSYPTLMFLDESGKQVIREIGAKDVKSILELGQRAMRSDDRSADFEKQYQEGNRDPEFVRQYIAALNKAGKPSLKVTNEYLQTQTDFSSEQNLRLILEGCVECDSRVFDLLTKNQKALEDLYGKEVIAARIEAACRATLKKSIEFKYLPLLQESKAKMTQYLPEKSESFGFEADRKYYGAVKDEATYSQSLKDFLKSSAKNDPAALIAVAKEASTTFPKSTKVMEDAGELAKKAAEKSKKAEDWMVLAEIQAKAGQTEKAIKTAQKAAGIARESNPGLSVPIDTFINNLKKNSK